jgi:hypothetical protein
MTGSPALLMTGLPESSVTGRPQRGDVCGDLDRTKPVLDQVGVGFHLAQAEREAAIERSGLPEAMARQWEAAHEIERLTYEASESEPRTMAGAFIQARTLTAYAEAEIEVGHYRGRGTTRGACVAQSLPQLSA